MDSSQDMPTIEESDKIETVEVLVELSSVNNGGCYTMGYVFGFVGGILAHNGVLSAINYDGTYLRVRVPKDDMNESICELLRKIVTLYNSGMRRTRLGKIIPLIDQVIGGVGPE